MVEVPVFPGDGDEIVTLVAASVMPGLVTVTLHHAERSWHFSQLSPPYVAVMASVPGVKLSDAVAAVTGRLAVAVLFVQASLDSRCRSFSRRW